MKFDIKKLKKDMKEIAIPIVAISLFIIIINSKFGKICPLRMLIGIPCPTCGTTRAVGLLLKGKITEAAMVNPIWIFLLVIIVMVFFYRYVEMAFQKRKRLLKFIDIMIFTTIAVVIAVYIYPTAALGVILDLFTYTEWFSGIQTKNLWCMTKIIC